MNTQISPAVLGKLEDFRSRRQRLIVLRGACAGLISVMIAMIMIAIIDWWLFLSPTARWGLSLLAYAIVAAIVWCTSVRLIWKIPDAAQMARLLEAAEPSLREDLVSAVELGDPHSENPWDSIAFRRFLQENIAHKMSGVNVRSLLPWQLIGRWISFASVAAILFLILLCLPGLHFGRRIARAMLPIASVERVSLTKIEIVSPNPLNTTVAQGEEIEVLVRISGPQQNDHVMLETIRESGGTSRVDMSPVPDGQRSFKSTVRMGRESIHYRVWANDARTTKHLLLSRQRPQVTSFHKTFRYPDYLQRESKTASDKSGDVVAVEGTEVDLVVDVNQPVTLAHLTVNSDSGEQTIPLTPGIDADGKLLNQVRGTLALARTGTYRIRLVGAETGLQNKFDPEYVIQAVPDAPPTIRIDQPGQAILIPSDEIVTLQAQAEDDWGLERIEQQVRVGDGEWATTTISEMEKPVSGKQLEHPWDIYPLGLEPGSVVFTKLVAVDRKGSRGESRMVRAVISSHDFDPQRWVGLAKARAVHDELIELLAAARQLKEDALAASDPQSAITAIASADAYDSQASTSLMQVHSALRSAPRGQTSIDLVRVGQAISQASTVGVGFARHHLATGSFEEARQAAEFVETRVKSATDSYDHLLRLAETAAIAGDLMSLRQMYRDAVNRAAPAAGSERIARRVHAIGSEAGVMADFVTEMREHADVNVKNELKSIEDDLRSLKKLGDPFAGPVGIDAIQSAGRPLESALSRSMTLFRRGLLDSPPPRRQLVSAAATTDGPTQRAARFARQLRDMKASLGEQAARGELDRLQQDAEKTKRTREWSAASFDAAVSGLMTLAALEKSRADGDSRFVADTSRAWRAIEAIRVKASEGGAQETQAIDDLDRLASAVQVLNLVHQVDDLIGIVASISDTDSATANASSLLLNPNQWFGAECEYQSLLGRLKQAAVSPQATTLLNESYRRDAYQLVRQEMSARPQLDRGIESRAAELTELLGDLRRVRALLQDPLHQARSVFQALSPRISQMLAELARDVRDDAEEFEAWLDQDDLNQEALAEQADQELDEAKHLAEQLEDLRGALREDASEQDVLDDEQRERMRDDDDALAMLEDQPHQMDDALRRAIQEEDPGEQQAALAEAAREQAELAQRLEQLAEHFQNLDRGDALQSRQALREAEVALGVRDQLEAQHQQLEQLAQLTELAPEQALAALEQELDENRVMQRELDALTREQLDQAQEQLAAAAQQQQQHAESVARQIERAESLRQWSEQLSRIGQNAEELGANQAAEAQQAAQAEQEQAAPNPFDQRDQAAEEQESRSNPSSQTDAIESAREQLAEAAQQAQAPSGHQRSLDELAEATEEVAQSLRRAANELQQASAAPAQPSAGNADPTSGESDPSDQPSPQAAQLARQAATAADQLADQAEQLAHTLDDAADVWEDEEMEDDPSDVWGDLEQEQIAEAVAEAQQDIEQAARNQQRLGNEENSQQLQQIAHEAQHANQLIEENQQSAQNSAAQSEPPGQSQPLGQLSEQLDDVQQAISDPAESLDDFLAGEDPFAATDEFSQPEAGDSEFGSELSNEFGPEPESGSEPTSESGAPEGQSESGESGSPESSATEPGSQEPATNGSEPGSSTPSGEAGAPSSEPGQPSSESGQPSSESGSGNESSPTLAPAAARQLAEALNSLDRQLLGQPTQQSPPGESSDDSSSSENSSQQASQPGSSSAQAANSSASQPAGESADAAQESSAGAANQSSASPPTQSDASQTSPSGRTDSGDQADSGGEPGSSPISEAIAAAAQAQSQQISAARSSSRQPSSSPVGQGYAEISGGAGLQGGPTAIGALPPIDQMKQADWAKLPPKLARELLEGRREKVSPQYRQAVETYFRLVAEKAKEN